jgi:hypothetical protein
MQRAKPRKRPCRVCRRWFLPDGRLKNRQKTCGNPECQRKWHRKKCAEWNKKNEEYFRTNYLQKKLEAAKSPEPNFCKSRLKTGLPLKFVQEVIGIQHLIIIEYLAQLLVRRSGVPKKTPPVFNTS